SARRCSRIMFVSEDSAQWIGSALGLASERRAVVHHGIDAAQWAPIRDSFALGRPGSCILSVSSIYRYKNYVRLIQAYGMLAQRHRGLPDLVILGDDQDPRYSQKMWEARAAIGGLAERIHIVGEVP